MCERSKSVKRIKVVILGGIMAALFSSLFGCNMIGNYAVNTVADELSNKYGKTLLYRILEIDLTMTQQQRMYMLPMIRQRGLKFV